MCANDEVENAFRATQPCCCALSGAGAVAHDASESTLGGIWRQLGDYFTAFDTGLSNRQPISGTCCGMYRRHLGISSLFPSMLKVGYPK